jgi:hypothetical protein
MKGSNTPGQALESGGVASFPGQRRGIFLDFPALAREWNHQNASAHLASLESQPTPLLFSLR